MSSQEKGMSALTTTRKVAFDHRLRGLNVRKPSQITYAVLVDMFGKCDNEGHRRSLQCYFKLYHNLEVSDSYVVIEGVKSAQETAEVMA